MNKGEVNDDLKLQTFNLFNLHNPIDKHPRSWICAKGDGLKALVKELEGKIIEEKSLTRESLSRLLAQKFNCSYGPFKYLLRGKSDFYPIPFINVIIEINNDATYFSKFKSKIEFLKVNSATSKEVKAIVTLTPELCKILGAFMADGSLTVAFQATSKNEADLKFAAQILERNGISYHQWYCESRSEHQVSFTINQTNYKRMDAIILDIGRMVNVQSHYDFELTDEHKSSVEEFRNWIFHTFNILPNSFGEKKGKNAWRVTYSNKILARYLTVFFEVIPGPKTYTAFEPYLIKSSGLENRKLFARGALMFDGSFTSAGKLCFSSKSKVFAESIKDILNCDKIDVGITVSGGNYAVYTYANVAKEKLLHYFEEHTHKWLRVQDFIGMKYQRIEDISKKYKVYRLNKVTFEKLYDSIKEVKSCDFDYLSSRFNCTKTTLLPYLTVLTNNGLIEISRHPKVINEEYLSTSTEILLNENVHKILFNKVKEIFGTYENFSHIIRAHKATISVWKLRKHRLPLCMLKQICSLCQIDLSLILHNIETTDRRIIEITSERFT